MRRVIDLPPIERREKAFPRMVNARIAIQLIRVNCTVVCAFAARASDVLMDVNGTVVAAATIFVVSVALGSRVAGWEHFAHGADIGVRGVGATLDEAFEQAAVALTAVITDPSLIAAVASVNISCEAPDVELLFADWLNALIYEMTTRGMLFRRFAVTVGKRSMTATAWGEPLDRVRHGPAVEPKGATYTALSVTQCSDGSWVAQCVIDV